MRQEGDSCRNGLIERFFRTFKEQAIWGRPFRTAAEVRTEHVDILQVGSPQTRLTTL
jgi:hypothetical protein